MAKFTKQNNPNTGKAGGKGANQGVGAGASKTSPHRKAAKQAVANTKMPPRGKGSC